MFTVRTVSGGTGRVALKDHTFPTKRAALEFIKGLPLGDRPTIARPAPRTWVVTLKR